MRSLPFLAAVTLTGCAPIDQNHPSLLPRAAESQSFAEVSRPIPIATPDPILDKYIAEQVAELDSIASDFNKGAQDAEARIAVARGTAIGSEPWLNAQAALATLDTLRAPILTILSDLETRLIDRGVAGEPPYPTLREAIARADALAKAQQARSIALEAALAGV